MDQKNIYNKKKFFDLRVYKTKTICPFKTVKIKKMLKVCFIVYF